MPRNLRISLALVVVCLACWMVLAWPAMQDDAFIHLRFAEHLLSDHFVTYDGVRRSFGASSLLFIALLAGVRAVWHSLLVPRAISSVAHVLLFAGLLTGLARALKRAPRLAWMLALLIVLSLSTPSAVRWLDDGMETSLVLCFITVFAFGAAYLDRPRRYCKAVTLGLGILSVLVVLLRVELLMFTGIYSLLLVVERSDALRGGEAGREPAVLGLAPLLGGVVGAGIILALMHSLLPDTAVAKSTGHFALGTLHSALVTLVSATTLGVGLLLAYLLSLLAVAAARRRSWTAIVLANCFFPLTIALATLRGQDIQGVRYFVWTMLFPALWNVLSLRHETEATGAPGNFYRVVVVCVLLVAVGSLAEAPLLLKEFRTRRTLLAQFRSEHLEQIHNLPIVAFDIGYIGYFTQASICDLGGLVNGREFARLNSSERFHTCIARAPRVAFVTDFTLYSLSATVPDYADWKLCQTYDFATLRDPRPHYLLAGPEVAPAVCAAAGGTPQPVTNIMPVALESQRQLIVPGS